MYVRRTVWLFDISRRTICWKLCVQPWPRNTGRVTTSDVFRGLKPRDKKTTRMPTFQEKPRDKFLQFLAKPRDNFWTLQNVCFLNTFWWFKHCNSILKLLLLVFNTIIFSTPLFCNPVVLIKCIPVVLSNIIQWFQSNYMPPSKSTPVILVKCTPIVFFKI